MSLPDVLRNAIAKMVADSWAARQYAVAAVAGDGTVSLAYGETAIDGVPCAATYPVHTVGDKVWVARSPAGVIEVLAKSNA